MNPIVAVIAPGMMGAAVGKRLVDHGIKVLTSIEGRSAETRERARTAGMAGVSDDEIATSDFILSILPPGDAVALAPLHRPDPPSSMPASSARHPNRTTRARASMPLGRKRRALPSSGSSDWTCACLRDT
jgi:hypothetical protein